MIKTNNLIYKSIMCITHYYMPHGLGNFTSIVLSCPPDGIDFYPFLQGKSQEGELPKRTKKQFIFNTLICLQSYSATLQKGSLVIITSCQSLRGGCSKHYFTLQTCKTMIRRTQFYKNKRTPITPLQLLETTSVVFIPLKTCQTTYHQHQTIISHAKNL